VHALLSATPSYHQLSDADRQRLEGSMMKVAAYAAECVRDDWLQTERLGQHPLVRYRESRTAPLVRAQESFRPSATSQVGRITQDTLRAIAFPTFVADLIKGTFEAITNSSIQQLEAYTRLLENVGMTVDQFMDSNISDDQARDWLVQRYPDHMQVTNRKLSPRDGAEDRRLPDFQADLNLSSGVDLDSDSMESTLVPAARRRMAQMRLQMLSTLVLMGMNRIVVTGGKIRASMLFHIDASDRLRQEHATDMDLRAAASASYGFGPWSVSASVSFAYVSSDRSTSDSNLNVSADLTGEVEIHFKSDYFPLERFAPGGTISQIQANTAVPSANTPNLGENIPWGSSIPAGTRQGDPAPSSLRPIGTVPAAPAPPASPTTPSHPAPQSGAPTAAPHPAPQPAATPAGSQPASQPAPSPSGPTQPTPQPSTSTPPAGQPQPVPAGAR
jgi:hypothetical protein